MLRPLHLLLMKERKQKWPPECDKAMLLSQQVFVHYDSRKPLRMATDAYPVGVGAVLSHITKNGDEKPIAFASRTLSSNEYNDAQIDKEALSIIYGIKKFHKCLYRRTFTLITDHMPLVKILGPKTAVPTLAALRMQRWALMLQVTLMLPIRLSTGSRRITRTPMHCRASHRPGRVPQRSLESAKCRLFTIYLSTLWTFAEKTRRDPVLSRVLAYVLTGRPNRVDKDLQMYFTKRDELSTEQGCLLWGS